MEEDSRTVKQLLMKILDKCRDALPEIATLTQRFDKMMQIQGNYKLKKKDCLNPHFLIKLSECCERIRQVLLQALQYDFPNRECLLHFYHDYMQAIKDMKFNHQQAHQDEQYPSHDKHKNSTTMKENLLRELQQETETRKRVEKSLGVVREKFARLLADRDASGRYFQEGDTHITISQISQILKDNQTQVPVSRERDKVIIQQEDSSQCEQLKSKIAQLQIKIAENNRMHELQLQQQREMLLGKGNNYGRQHHDQQSGKLRKLLAEKDRAHQQELEKLQRTYELELQQQGNILNQKEKVRFHQLEQELALKDKQHRLQLEQQRRQIIELQLNFDEFIKANPAVRNKNELLSFKNLKIDSIPPLKTNLQQKLDQSEFYRWMLVQASTIEEYLNQSRQ